MGATEPTPPAGSRSVRRRTATSPRARPDAPAAGCLQLLRSASTTAPPHADSPAHAHRPPGHLATWPPGHLAGRRTAGPRRLAHPPPSTAEIAPPEGGAERRQIRPGAVGIDQERSEEPRPQTPNPSPIRQPQPHTAGTPPHRHDAWAAVSARRPLHEMRARGTVPDPVRARHRRPRTHDLHRSTRERAHASATATRAEARQDSRTEPTLGLASPPTGATRVRAPAHARTRLGAARYDSPSDRAQHQNQARARLEHSGRPGSGEPGVSTAC